MHVKLNIPRFGCIFKYMIWVNEIFDREKPYIGMDTPVKNIKYLDYTLKDISCLLDLQNLLLIHHSVATEHM
jgi:hypothetical protein